MKEKQKKHRHKNMARYEIIKGKSCYKCSSVSVVAALIDDKTAALQKWAVNNVGEYLLEMAAGGVKIEQQQIKEAAAAYNKKLTQAGDFGTLVHHYLSAHINNLINKNMPPAKIESCEDKLIKTMYASFMQWEKCNVKKWIASEMVVCDFDKVAPLAGRFDALAEMQSGAVAVIDFKTSNGIYASAYAQIGGYAELISRTSGNYSVKMGEEEKIETFKKVKLPVPTEAYVLHLSKNNGALVPHYLNASTLLKMRGKFAACRLLFDERLGVNRLITSCKKPAVKINTLEEVASKQGGAIGSGLYMQHKKEFEDFFIKNEERQPYVKNIFLQSVAGLHEYGEKNIDYDAVLFASREQAKRDLAYMLKDEKVLKD